jgi:ABC-type amino acid transport system permease subunit
MTTTLDIRSLIKRPSAFVPITMSLAAFAILVGYLAIFGKARQADEGAAAHLWQLLIVAQIPLVAFFVIKWIPHAPRPALRIFALQVGALLFAVAPVYFLHL